MRAEDRLDAHVVPRRTYITDVAGPQQVVLSRLDPERAHGDVSKRGRLVGADGRARPRGRDLGRQDRHRPADRLDDRRGRVPAGEQRADRDRRQRPGEEEGTSEPRKGREAGRQRRAQERRGEDEVAHPRGVAISEADRQGTGERLGEEDEWLARELWFNPGNQLLVAPRDVGGEGDDARHEGEARLR